MLRKFIKRILIGFSLTVLTSLVIGILLIFGLGWLFFIFVIFGVWLLSIEAIASLFLPMWILAVLSVLIFFFGHAYQSSWFYPEDNE